MTLEASQIAGRAAAGSDSRFDLLLHRTWIIKRDASHPQYPGRFVLQPEDPAASGTLSPSPGVSQSQARVRAGSVIMLRSCGGSASLLLSATALEDGMTGEVIRFRSSLGTGILRGRLMKDGDARLVMSTGMESGGGW